MLKQKVIPIVGAAVLLFSCGGSKVTTISVDTPYHEIGLISEAFEAKKGKKFTFTVDISNLPEPEKNEDESGSTIAFLKTPVPQEGDPDFVDSFINEKKSISITYNNKKMERFEGEINKFAEYIENKEWGKVDNKFAIKPYEIEGRIPAQLLLLCHSEKKSTDKITYTLTSAANEKVAACYINMLEA